MPESCPLSLSEAVQKLRDSGSVPLGVIAYDVEKDMIRIHLFRDMSLVDANAILEKIGIEVTPDTSRI